MSKKLVKSLMWAAIMIVVQVAVSLIQHVAINWIEVLVGAIIVFMISYGTKSGPIYVPEKKQKGKNVEKVENSNNVSKEVRNNNATQKNTSNLNMDDLRFYSYNRMAYLSIAMGIGAIVLGYMRSTFWFYIVGAYCFVQAIVFFVLYTQTRNEFVNKEKEQRTDKK